MDDFLTQISKYLENVPLWPFLLFGVIAIVALAVEIVNRKRREDAIECFRHTIETELASMYPKHIRWPENINHYLCSRLPEMHHNFEVLKIFIPQKLLRDYNIAWNKYCDFCRDITDEKCAASEQSAKNSTGAGSSNANESDLEAEFHKLVSDLLAYTKL
ncbi:MAG: hypothetical protein H6936_10115 [Burkholderiales bacterium]|nr:hypothetical protein [Nitrosomonas sp.]MCP5275185.1 hypothetical protein [Burkholderiales bacterium]